MASGNDDGFSYLFFFYQLKNVFFQSASPGPITEAGSGGGHRPSRRSINSRWHDYIKRVSRLISRDKAIKGVCARIHSRNQDQLRQATAFLRDRRSMTIRKRCVVRSKCQVISAEINLAKAASRSLGGKVKRYES